MFCTEATSASLNDSLTVRSGRLIIINNVNFKHAMLGERTGSEKDVRRLREAFQVLGFSVDVADDQSAYQMLQLIIESQFPKDKNPLHQFPRSKSVTSWCRQPKFHDNDLLPTCCRVANKSATTSASTVKLRGNVCNGFWS